MGQIVSDVTQVLDTKKSNKEAESQRQQILMQMSADQASKQNLVKKAVATQRAKYGASGMSTKGVTEGAVLKRLRSETEEPYNEKLRQNYIKYNSIKNSRPNILKSLLSRFDDIVG